jgi:hypothetical protein
MLSHMLAIFGLVMFFVILYIERRQCVRMRMPTKYDMYMSYVCTHICECNNVNELNVMLIDASVHAHDEHTINNMRSIEEVI